MQYMPKEELERKEKRWARWGNRSSGWRQQLRGSWFVDELIHCEAWSSWFVDGRAEVNEARVDDRDWLDPAVIVGLHLATFSKAPLIHVHLGSIPRLDGWERG